MEIQRANGGGGM